MRRDGLELTGSGPAPQPGDAVEDDTRSSSVLYRTLRPDATGGYPIVARADGSYIWDRSGRRYLDAISGAMVVGIGHRVPAVLDAIRAQFENISFAYSGTFASEPAIDLADLLVERAPDGITKVFFVSGGSEATESALKLARQYFVARGQPSKWRFIGRWGSYHGNTLATLSASGRPEWRRSFEPMLLPFPLIGPCSPSHCRHCSAATGCTLRCADELEETILREGPDEIAGFIAEPVPAGPLTGTAPPAGYFERIREICDRYDVLFIADEIITAFGRLGRWFGISGWTAVPDMIACGKGMTSGYTPLAALLVHERVADVLTGPGITISHGFTFGGNPMSCAIAVAVLEHLQSNELVERSRRLGASLYERAQRLWELDAVAEVRGGDGLFLGVELAADRDTLRPFGPELRVAQRIASNAFDQGVIVSLAHGGPQGRGGDCAIVAPPFIVTEEELDDIVTVLHSAIAAATDAAA